MKKAEQMVLMGNEAIGRGLVESGCSMAASYPGTPASEILESTVMFSKQTGTKMHLEWSVNEKVAFEVALANSYTGKRSAVAMKQVGLNVASDPFMRSAYIGVKGGLVVIVADDPGPHSSQTEQDSRFFARFAKIPVFDPSYPKDAKEMVTKAFDLSEKYEIPAMIRPTTSVCHARQNVPCLEPQKIDRTANFEKNPGRWVATPQFLYNLHSLLNGKIKDIAKEDVFCPSVTPGDGSFDKCCIISSGVAWAHIFDLLDDMKLSKKIDLFKVDMPFPLNEKFIEKINSEYENVLVVEETYPVIEMQLVKEKVKGRLSGYVPNQGELTPDIIEDILKEFLEIPIEVPETVESEKGVRPSLCPGCPHRAAFFAIRETFPGGIFPSDIGCYTLGMNLGAVDTCHCMGACISQGAGFYHAYAQDGKDFPTIVVTIGDSTFFHAGVPGLINAVFQKARFILVILDNSTTAMTGHQPTPQLGVRANGTEGNPVLIENLVAACGVKFQKECDSYDMNQFISHLKEADRYCRSEDGGVAVIISKHPCLVNKKAKEAQSVYLMNITEDCTGCRKCVEKFECAALVFRQEEKKVIIDQNICVGCGVCRHVCPVSAITAYKKEDGR